MTKRLDAGWHVMNENLNSFWFTKFGNMRSNCFIFVDCVPGSHVIWQYDFSPENNLKNNKNGKHVIMGKHLESHILFIYMYLEAGERIKQTQIHTQSNNGIFNVWRIQVPCHYQKQYARSTSTTGCFLDSCFQYSVMCKKQTVITWWLWEIYLFQHFFFFVFFFHFAFDYYFSSFLFVFNGNFIKLWNICFAIS